MSRPYTSQQLTSVYNARTKHNAALPTTYADEPGRMDLGLSGETMPTVWEAVNYPHEEQFEFDSFWIRYERQALARAIIDKPVNDTWQEPPTVRDEASDQTESETTQFDDRLEQFFAGEHTRRKPTHRLNVADKLGRLGEFSLIVLGFGDGRDLASPVKGVEDEESGEFGSLDDLHYIATFGQDRVIDFELNTDMTSPRFRLPKSFEVITQEVEEDDTSPEQETQTIHWSRCIHVPEGTLEDDLRGTPALKPVFHELLNVDKIKAASGEGYWRAGYQGMIISPPKDDRGRLMEFEDDGEGVQEEISKFLNNFERTIASQADVQTLESSVGDPRPHLEANYESISAAVDIPKSILTGEDRADTAASEDVRQWHQKIGQRRNDHAGPVILEPLIHRLIDVGILPEPSGDGFTVDWPPLDELSELQESEMNLTQAKALKAMSPGGDPTHMATVPELRQMFGWNPEVGSEVAEEFRVSEEDVDVDEAALREFQAQQEAPAPDEFEEQQPAADASEEEAAEESTPPDEEE